MPPLLSGRPSVTIPTMGIEDLLAPLGLQLPPAQTPVASYIPVRMIGELAYVSAQIPMMDGQILHPGHLGDRVSLEQGQEAARQCALQALSALKEALGSLDRVRGIIQVFGETGKHARAAVGVAELPLGAPVEVAVLAKVD